MFLYTLGLSPWDHCTGWLGIKHQVSYSWTNCFFNFCFISLQGGPVQSTWTEHPHNHQLPAGSCFQPPRVSALSPQVLLSQHHAALGLDRGRRDLSGTRYICFHLVLWLCLLASTMHNLWEEKGWCCEIFVGGTRDGVGVLSICVCVCVLAWGWGAVKIVYCKGISIYLSIYTHTHSSIGFQSEHFNILWMVKYIHVWCQTYLQWSCSFTLKFTVL